MHTVGTYVKALQWLIAAMQDVETQLNAAVVDYLLVGADTGASARFYVKVQSGYAQMHMQALPDGSRFVRALAPGAEERNLQEPADTSDSTERAIKFGVTMLIRAYEPYRGMTREQVARL